ncbi:hypothetical protein RHGRI_001652 [Rhododendron griersonianum]|uniref:DUF4283 domain-containing protein n=1 Tax=Rhododendron griersonianum TaxID=479676 RepID=A0AAV6LKW1_9ERIC|nr:hypothetical protein RHGRI_001652 [Rhododendron griersonianum]
MADGTISMAEGLGIKALDSNELRRKQVPHMESPKSGIPFALNPLGASFSGLGAHSPKSSKNTSPSRKLQQVFFEEGLRVQAEAATKSSVPPSSSNGSEEQNPSSPKLAISTTTIGFGARSPKSAKTQGLSQKPDNQPSSVLNQGSPKEGTHSDSEARMLEIVGNLEDELNTSEDPFILDVLTAKLLSIQQEWNKSGKQAEEQIALRNQSSKAMQKNQQAIFEDGLMKEAEAKARVIHLHGNTYQFQRTPSEVRKLNPNSQQLPSTSVIKTAEMPKVSSVNAPQSRPLNNGNQSTLRNSSISGQHPQFKPKQKNDQAKPKNWASLLQSQSPSLDMKLEFFPDLLRGKEAQVEIDIELTDVGMWTKYLVGHFLDGNMPYPLVASTARYQWKELFVAVKPDVGGCYLFEFRDEQAKQQVLDGGPYFFSQKYLVLKDWHRMMKPVKEQPTHIPAWVKLHNLPLELWNQECLSRIASTIGKPLHVDQATAKTSRQPGLLQTKSTNARICIEISAENELPDEVRITVEGESVVVFVEYQVLPSLCKECQVFGHSTDHCSKKPPPITSQPLQEWTVVGSGKLRANPPYKFSGSTSTTLPSTTKLEGKPQAELADSDDDSEEELEKVLESIVSSSQEKLNLSQSTEANPPMIPTVNSAFAIEEAAHNLKEPNPLSLQELTDPSNQTETLETVGANKEEAGTPNQQTTSPNSAIFITKSAAKKAAKMAAKLKDKEPPNLIPDIKLTGGGSGKA